MFRDVFGEARLVFAWAKDTQAQLGRASLFTVERFGLPDTCLKRPDSDTDAGR